MVFVSVFVGGCTAPRYALSGVKESRLIESKNDSKFFVQVEGKSGWEQEFKGLLETYLKEKEFRVEASKTDNDILVLTVTIKKAEIDTAWKKHFVPRFTKTNILTDVSLTRGENIILEFTLFSKAPIYDLDVFVPRRSAVLDSAAKEIVNELSKRLRK